MWREEEEVCNNEPANQGDQSWTKTAVPGGKEGRGHEKHKRKSMDDFVGLQVTQREADRDCYHRNGVAQDQWPFGGHGQSKSFDDAENPLEIQACARFGCEKRLPGWCASPRVTVNGEAVDLGSAEQGYLRIERLWQSGDQIVIELPMPVQRVHAHPAVAADLGQTKGVALWATPFSVRRDATNAAHSVQRETAGSPRPFPRWLRS